MMMQRIPVGLLGSALVGLLNCGPPRECPDFPRNMRNMAIQVMEDYPEVVDAAISVSPDRSCSVSLAVIVAHRLSEQEARDLGDGFVRLAKSFGPDDSPGRSVGSGIYDYHIGVYLRDESPLAQGAKVSVAERISW